MSARRLWILLLLAAVFSMHGAQYVAADPAAGQGAMVSAQHGISAGGTGVTISDSARGGVELPPATSGTAPTAAGVSMPTVPAHDVAAHMFSLCVAVLLAGLVLLGAMTLVRRVTGYVGWDGGVRRRLRMGWFRLPRPPDLASLCLLRI